MQSCQIALYICKSRTRYLGGTLFVNPVALLADFPVVFGFKIKLGLLAYGFGDDIFILGCTYRHVVQRHVRDLFQ
jgi:hypothetical protein